MYRANRQSEVPDFHLPVGGKLDPENRWGKLARVVPWHLIERRLPIQLRYQRHGRFCKRELMFPISKQRLHNSCDFQSCCTIKQIHLGYQCINTHRSDEADTGQTSHNSMPFRLADVSVGHRISIVLPPKE